MDLSQIDQFYIIDPHVEQIDVLMEARHILVKWRHLSFLTEAEIAKKSEDAQHRPDTLRSIVSLYNLAKTLPPETKIMVKVIAYVQLKANPEYYRQLWIYAINDEIISFFDVKPLVNSAPLWLKNYYREIGFNNTISDANNKNSKSNL